MSFAAQFGQTFLYPPLRRRGVYPQTFKRDVLYRVLDAVSRAAEWTRRLPDPRLKRRAAPPEVRRAVGELQRDGLSLWPAFVAPDRLARMRTAFESSMERAQSIPEEGQRYSDDPICDKAILDLLTDPFLLSVVEGYLNRRFMLGKAVATRLYPADANCPGTSFQWHHDNWGRRVHLMVLLTPVAPDGQRCTFLKGSHRLYHRYGYLASRFTDEQIARDYGAFEPAEIAGPAGTVALFDANGIHRGTRRQAAVRDVVIGVYCTGRDRSPLTIPSHWMDGYSDEQRKVILNNDLIH